MVVSKFSSHSATDAGFGDVPEWELQRVPYLVSFLPHRRCGSPSRLASHSFPWIKRTYQLMSQEKHGILGAARRFMLGNLQNAWVFIGGVQGTQCEGGLREAHARNVRMFTRLSPPKAFMSYGQCYSM